MMVCRWGGWRLLIVLVFMCVCNLLHAREWHHGGRTTDGELERVAKDIIVVKTTSGSNLIIRRADLSSADVAYVTQWLKAQNATPATSAPAPHAGSMSAPTRSSSQDSLFGNDRPVRQTKSKPAPRQTVSQPNAPIGDLADELSGITPGEAYEPDDGSSELQKYLTSLPGMEHAGDNAVRLTLSIAAGLLMLMFVLVIMGVLLRWACQIAKQKEPPGVLRGFGILVLATILQAIINYGLAVSSIAPGLQRPLSVAMNTFILWGLIIWLCDTRPGEGCVIILLWLLLILAASVVLVAVVAGGAVLFRIASGAF